MRKPSELNIANAIAYTKERQEAERCAVIPSVAMADCITSGLSGKALTDALTVHFPTAARHDVYRAIGLAVALMQADLTLAEMELAMGRQAVAA